MFGAQELAIAYGECACMQLDIKFLKSIESREKNEFIYLKPDTKEVIQTLFKLNALFKI